MKTFVLLLIVFLIVYGACWFFYNRLYRQHQVAKQLRRYLGSTTFNHIATHFSRVDGMTLSITHRDTHDADPEFTYGEIDLATFVEVLLVCEPQAHEVFYELGSGVGKNVIACAALFPIAESIGIELLPALFDSAQNSVAQLQSVMALQKVEFIHGDFFSCDWQRADIIFINATAFNADRWQTLVEHFCKVKSGTRVIVTSHRLPNSEFECLEAGMRLMSWGLNSLFIFRRR